MTAQAIQSPLPTFTGLDGLPLSGGYVYFGVANADPVASPASVFYDEAMTIPAVQPLRTTAGFVYRNGGPASLWISGSFSIKVLDSNSRQVFYLPECDPSTAISAAMAPVVQAATLALGRAALGSGATGDALFTAATAAAARAAIGGAASGANSDIASLTALASINGGPLAGLRNRLINGNFKINQRGAASGSTAYGAGAYVMDRWKAGAAGCTLSWAVSGSDVTVTITAGSLMQVVEDLNVEGGTYALSNQGTAQARIAVNGAATSGAYAAASTAAPLVSASATGLQTVTVEFTTGTLSKVQLEPGSVGTSFERRPYSLELLLCQRYCESVSLGLQVSNQLAGQAIVASQAWRVAKRGVPTTTVSGISSANVSAVNVVAVDANYVQVQGTNATASAVNFFQATVQGVSEL